MADAEGAMDRRVRRVLFAPVPHIDESLMGLVRRCAADNDLSSAEPIIREATSALRACDNLAVRTDLDRRALASAMRLPFEQVGVRFHERSSASDDRGLVDFFGAGVPISDLRLSHRPFASGVIDQEHAGYHRAIWNHVGIPFDRSTGERLTDRCPGCRRLLGWGGGGPLTLCNMCGRDARSDRAENVGERVVRDSAILTGLLEPDPIVRLRDCGSLHADLLALDRGGAFELGRRIGRALTETTAKTKGAAGSLPLEQQVAALVMGAEVMKDWPESLTDRAKHLLAVGDDKANRLLRTIHAMSAETAEWPCLGALLRSTHPELVEHCRASAKALHPNHLDGAGAARFLGTSARSIPLLQNAGAIVPVWSGGDANIHSLFMPSSLERLRDAIADGAGLGKAAEALGIGHHGVEQLIVLDVIAVVEAPGLELVHKGRRISRTSLTGLLERLGRLPRHEDDDADSRPTLRRAMVHVGGREKPWGPVIKAILDGSLVATRRASRPGTRPIDALTVRSDDVATIVAMSFDRNDHPRFGFTRVMPIRDAGSLLNINPAGLQKALAGELRRCARDGGLAVEPTLAIARSRIGGAEIAARFNSGSRRLPRFLTADGLPRMGPLGWDRAAVEQAFARADPRDLGDIG